ncbi:hypothetical protein P3T40_006867 [Paraburkholderia sp. EB58]|jgi:hypothetical protein
MLARSEFTIYHSIQYTEWLDYGRGRMIGSMSAAFAGHMQDEAAEQFLCNNHLVISVACSKHMITRHGGNHIHP